jgi:hypothetical protein
VVVGTFPGFETRPPPHRPTATAADGWEKKKKEEDKEGGQGISSPSLRKTKTTMNGGKTTTWA